MPDLSERGLREMATQAVDKGIRGWTTEVRHGLVVQMEQTVLDALRTMREAQRERDAKIAENLGKGCSECDPIAAAIREEER